jgi:CRISPR-associated protein Csm2
MATQQSSGRPGNHSHQNRQEPPPNNRPSRIDVGILETGIESRHIENLKSWGEYFANNAGGRKVSTSQLRKFFGEIKRIQADFDNCKVDLILLDPKIAYAVGRAKKDARQGELVKIEDFYNQITPLIGRIGDDHLKFKRFVQLCEAIVAYHKQFGGDN